MLNNFVYILHFRPKDISLHLKATFDRLGMAIPYKYEWVLLGIQAKMEWIFLFLCSVTIQE